VSTATAEMTELELLHRFIADQLADGRRRMPVDECLREFRAYLREVERLREEIRPALERSLRGESEPLDFEDLKQRGRDRLRQQGIAD
jgi:Arc/MetJ-type ribon-helix-helix transcriptional regulator